MAKSKRVDETGLPNDTRSIHLEKTDQDLRKPYNVTEEDLPEPSEHLTNKIVVPEHLRKMLGI